MSFVRSRCGRAASLRLSADPADPSQVVVLPLATVLRAVHVRGPGRLRASCGLLSGELGGSLLLHSGALGAVSGSLLLEGDAIRGCCVPAGLCEILRPGPAPQHHPGSLIVSGASPVPGRPAAQRPGVPPITREGFDKPGRGGVLLWVDPRYRGPQLARSVADRAPGALFVWVFLQL